MSKICNSCTTENVDEAKFCRKCGKNKFNTSETDRSIVVSLTEEITNDNKQTFSKNSKSKPDEQKGILKDDDTILSVFIHIVLFVGFGYLLHIG